MRRGDSTGGGSSLSSRRQERNLREKDRRLELKHRLAGLLNLLPSSNPFRVSTMDTVHEATVHIEQLKERLASLNTRKQELLLHQVEGTAGSGKCSSNDGSRQVQIQTQDWGSAMEINLVVSGLNSKIRLHQVIRAVQGGGALVVAASYRTTTNNTTNNTTIFTIHLEAISGRIGIDTSTVVERLRELSK